MLSPSHQFAAVSSAEWCEDRGPFSRQQVRPQTVIPQSWDCEKWKIRVRQTQKVKKINQKK